jgi:hypothetical protein
MAPLLVLLAVAVVVVLIAVSVGQASERKRNLEAVGRPFRGVVTEGWFQHTTLEMAVDGTPVQLSYHSGSKNSAAFTRIRFRRPFGTRLRVVPDGVWETIKKAFWSEDLQVGDRDFDAAFVVQGYPAPWVKRVLDVPLRNRIRHLAEMGSGILRGPSVTVEAGPTGLLVALPRDIVDDRSVLQAFLAAAVELFRALHAPVDEGITFVTTEEVVADGRCPVCEHPLGAGTRRCGSCATPHHADCWAYFGGCSTFACKENP